MKERKNEGQKEKKKKIKKEKKIVLRCGKQEREIESYFDFAILNDMNLQKYVERLLRKECKRQYFCQRVNFNFHFLNRAEDSCCVLTFYIRNWKILT